MENRTKMPSWGKIILCFILFYPVGIFFLWQRVRYNRETARKFRKILKVFGYFCLVGAAVLLIGLIGGMGSQTDDETEIIIGGFFVYLVLGVLMLYASKRMNKFENHFIIYKDIIMNQNERSIEIIALQVGLSCKKTQKELQKMIDRGYFDEAYINMESQEIIVPNRAQHVQAPVSQSVHIAQATVPPNRSAAHQSTAASQPNRIYVSQSISTAPPREKVVKCPNCGGMNRVRTGTISECDFCGSPIS